MNFSGANSINLKKLYSLLVAIITGVLLIFINCTCITSIISFPNRRYLRMTNQKTKVQMYDLRSTIVMKKINYVSNGQQRITHCLVRISHLPSIGQILSIDMPKYFYIILRRNSFIPSKYQLQQTATIHWHIY